MKYALVVMLGLSVAACSKSSSTSTSPTGPSGSDTTISFASQVQPIFNASCAVSGCHVAGGSAPMSLEAGKSYSQTVNVSSIEQPALDRVTPFSPDKSYLYLKITGQGGTRMPLGRAALGSADVNTIESWISQGAKNN